MEALIYLDTHVAAWLYAGQSDLLSPRAANLIEEEELRISPMVILDLEYLREIGRLTVSGNSVARTFPLSSVCRYATSPSRRSSSRLWTNTGRATRSTGSSSVNAALAASPLLTKDQTIRRHYRLARW